MTLGYMRPLLAKNNIRNGHFGYAIFGGQCTLRYASHRKPLANFSDLLATKFCMAVSFAACIPLLLAHVAQVVGVSAKKKMVWISAFWVIATMAHYNASRDGTKVEHVGNTGRMMSNALPMGTAVSVPVKVTTPLPAFVRAALDNFLPETINVSLSSIVTVNKLGLLTWVFGYSDRLTTTAFAEFWGIMGLHRNLPFCAKSQGVPAPLGQLFSSFNYTTGGTV